uniref:Sperm flagellar 1 n=1 Tax=Callorhinchus milii TaxID=7868 RepID=A0A4W3HZK0_CALMI|eukprot:gi/632937030/ref/XP_007897058.1/ PREDICTED: sperm flagellar protein 1-like isoform X1 [Callorhinchus milii]
MDAELGEDALQEVYSWIDQIPLSRAKRNIARDFSDGVMAAEVVKHFLPKVVEMHNYIPANSSEQKLTNWVTLNRKVFSKLQFRVPEEVVKKLVKSSSGIIEPVLYTLKQRIEEELHRKQAVEGYSNRSDQTLPDQTHLLMHSFEKKGQAYQGELGHNPRSGYEEYSALDPKIRLLLEEKEQALLALQETVEILQMKVHRLEHLVQLKDLRIDDLTRHLEKHKSKGNAK